MRKRKKKQKKYEIEVNSLKRKLNQSKSTFKRILEDTASEYKEK